MKQQNQKDSIGFQIETINVGMSIDEIKLIVNGLFYDNFIKLKEEAKEIVDRRLLEFSEKLFDQLQDKNINSLSNPDVQYSLYKATESYVRTSSNEKHKLLISMISDKIKSSDETNYSLMLSQALELISKLSIKHINLLSFLVVLKNLELGQLKSIKLPRDEEKFKAIFDSILMFIDFIITKQDIRYLSNYGLGTFLFSTNLDELLIEHYPNLFIVEELNKNKIKPLNEKKYANINGQVFGIREYIESLDSRYKKIFYVFDDLELNSLSISPIAEIIGLINYNINISDSINLQEWYL